MQILRQKKINAVVGLDIEAGSIAATEISVNGSTQIRGVAVEPLAPGAFHEGEVADGDTLTAALKSLFAEHKLSKRVRLGVGNQGVVVRTVRLPAIEDPKELAAAVRFQAQEQIPMPLDQAVLEHQVVGGVAVEEGPPQIDVVVIAARREMISSLLEPVRRAGLEPIGVDLSAFGMIRALAGVEVGAENGGQATEPGARPLEATLFCSVGDVMNIAIARAHACLFTRTSHAGLEPIVTRLATGSGLSYEHAGLWLDHVGLDAPTEAIEGDPTIVAEARTALEAAVAAMVDELRLSLDYYRAQEGAIPIQRVVLCGPGSVISGLAARMEEGLGLPIASAHPPALSDFDARLSARLTLPYGLALEN